MRVTPSGPVKANRRVRARVPAAGKMLEGDDQPTLSALYYDMYVLFSYLATISINALTYLLTKTIVSRLHQWMVLS